MDKYELSEQSYKNGYTDGLADGIKIVASTSNDKNQIRKELCNSYNKAIDCLFNCWKAVCQPNRKVIEATLRENWAEMSRFEKMLSLLEEPADQQK